MKRLFAVKLLFFVLISCSGQSNQYFDNYAPLICKGDIPQDFKTELSKLVEKEKMNQQSQNKKDKEQAVTFSELSNYQLKNILYSGKVLYGDALTEYVNKVADVILVNDKKLRSKIRFYVLKNTDLNAYSTQSGIIFISLGLLAQIESEAQLAFIMCHEMVHFKNNHNLEAYKKRNEILSNSNKVDLDRKVSSILNYSKENELEADRVGLDYFLKTPYGTGEINNLFDVMLYSYLPFDEISFDSLYFNAAKGYVMPKGYFLSKVSEITAEEDVADSMSTHPNIKKRRETIQLLLKSNNKNDGASFVQPETEFHNIQRIARYELAIAYMQDAELEQALYTGYLIEKVYGKSLFSDKIIVSALYAKSKQKSYYNYSSKNNKSVGNEVYEEDDENAGWKKVEGESQNVYHFMYTIPAKELSILAARKLVEYKILYKDNFFSERLKSVVYDLVYTFDLNKSDFIDGAKLKADTFRISDEVITDTLEPVSENRKLSKVSKIKKAKTQSDKKSKEQDSKYFKFAFHEYYQDSLLNEYFQNTIIQKEDEEKLHESENYKNYKMAVDRLTVKNGEALNIKRLVLINPFYSNYITKIKYDWSSGRLEKFSKSNPEVTPLEEEKVEENLLNSTLEYADKLGLDVAVIGGTRQTSIETDKFNDFQQLINWLSERISLGKMGAYTFSDQYMDQYVKEYGYMGFCRVVKNNDVLELVFVLFNLETGGSELVYDKRLSRGKPDGIHVKMMLYDIMHRIRQEPNKINKLKKEYHIDE